MGESSRTYIKNPCKAGYFYSRILQAPSALSRELSRGGASSIEENPGAPPPQYAYGAYAGASAAPKPPASRTFLDYTFGRNRPRAVEEETESPKERAAGFDI